MTAVLVQKTRIARKICFAWMVFVARAIAPADKSFVRAVAWTPRPVTPIAGLVATPVQAERPAKKALANAPAEKPIVAGLA